MTTRTVPQAKGRIKQFLPAGPTLAFQYDPEKFPFTPGVGGWNRVQRPQQVEAIEWAGTPASEIPFDLWFDGYPDTSVEHQVGQLEAWGQPGRNGSPPPVLQLLYAGLLNYRWVLNGLTPVSEIRRSDGQRVQACMTVTLLEHVGLGDRPSSADSVRRSAFTPGLGPAAVVVAKTRTYVVKAGDTLPKIAARLLGKAARWKDIAKINQIRDPAVKLKVGRKLKIPAS